MPKTILIVDDDPNILDTAKDILEDAGYVVKTAATAQAAMEKLRQTPAHLAIIDFNLPDSTGIQLAIDVKKQCPDVAILLLTGQAHVDLGQAKEAVTDLLTKPVNPAQLIHIIRQVVDS